LTKHLKQIKYLFGEAPAPSDSEDSEEESLNLQIQKLKKFISNNAAMIKGDEIKEEDGLMEEEKERLEKERLAQEEADRKRREREEEDRKRLEAEKKVQQQEN